ncbi:LysM domain-containing protein [Pseudarthrobacter sp. C4D7]|uniref:LysM peptidoglycan-binding domain-containing protein n=1 Tax=Pseudarthrobacter sp. C4D7 TaxID=2735268 RepID=UPI00158473C6|nr:LysM domain-containing protein [Pseudarthrobacter sp. C4D7]NUT69691.1 LysM peptidoglycan-binding domain-containing protein [Pseudarthrobacter sp. C4D7]
MNQPPLPSPEGPSRSFATDEPRTDLSTGRPAISNKLWAGMATAAVVAAVGVGAIAAPPAPLNGSTTAAAHVTGAPAPQPVSTAAPAPPAAAPGGASVAEAVAAEAPVPVPAPAAEAPAEPAPEAPAPAAEPAPAGDPNLYTVVPGDTVGAIAAAYGVDMNAMLAANGLSAFSIIYPGETLLLTGPPIAVAQPAPAPAAVAAPAPAPAPVAAQAPAPAAAVQAAPAPAAPAVRTIYVAGSGGQSMVDACIGPIHYTPNDGYSLFITEHDFCGGWARFSGIGVRETVSIPGYGTYTVTGRGTVPNPGTTNDVIAVFGGFPRAILQTCIPGTSTMLLVALN